MFYMYDIHCKCFLQDQHVYDYDLLNTARDSSNSKLYAYSIKLRKLYRCACSLIRLLYCGSTRIWQHNMEALKEREIYTQIWYNIFCAG